MRRWLFILAAVVAAGVILAGSAAVVSPVTVPSAAAASQKGCMGGPIHQKPGIAGPYRVGRSIHFGFAEWNFPPSCRDEMRSNYVKIYRVKKGQGPQGLLDHQRNHVAQEDAQGDVQGEGPIRLPVLQPVREEVRQVAHDHQDHNRTHSMNLPVLDPGADRGGTWRHVAIDRVAGGGRTRRYLSKDAVTDGLALLLKWPKFLMAFSN